MSKNRSDCEETPSLLDAVKLEYETQENLSDFDPSSVRISMDRIHIDNDQTMSGSSISIISPLHTSDVIATDVFPEESDVPESVQIYERQRRRVEALNISTNQPLDPIKHLNIVHEDDHIIVVNKPSGVLCVPGLNDKPSVANLVYNRLIKREKDDSDTADLVANVHSMIVHRLDMDTSGLVVFGKTKEAVRRMNESFRLRQPKKKYEALVCGKVPAQSGIIDLALQRDHRHPPFMRVSTTRSEAEAAAAVADLNHAGYKKLIMKRPKPSLTSFRVLGTETLGKDEGMQEDIVTRVELEPMTGRTHQLRVHCAAMGHAIVADPAYGIGGEAAPNGGLNHVPWHIPTTTCTNDHDQILDWTGTPPSVLEEIDDLVQRTNMTMCLHARELRMEHPMSREEVVFQSKPNF